MPLILLTVRRCHTGPPHANLSHTQFKNPGSINKYDVQSRWRWEAPLDQTSRIKYSNLQAQSDLKVAKKLQPNY